MCLFVEKINLAHYRRNEKVLKTVVHSLYVKSYFNYAVRVHLDTGGSHIRRVVPIMCCYSSSILRCSLFSVQFSSVAQSCPDSATPWTAGTPGFPVHHQLAELTQTHVQWVCDAFQPSHPLSSPFPPTFNLSEHQGLFKEVSSSHQVAKVLELQLQHQSFQWSPLGLTGWISLQYKGLSRVFSNTTVQKHQFFGAQLSL